SGSLLAPRLRAAAGHLGPGLRAVGPGALVCQLGGDDLVHHGHVRLDAEQGLGEIDAGRLGAAQRADVELHASPPDASPSASDPSELSAATATGTGAARDGGSTC